MPKTTGAPSSTGKSSQSKSTSRGPSNKDQDANWKNTTGKMPGGGRGNMPSKK